MKYQYQRKNTIALDHILAPNLNVQICRLHQMLKIYKAPHLNMQICHVRVVAQILHPVPHRHPTLKVIYQIFQYSAENDDFLPGSLIGIGIWGCLSLMP